MAFWAAAIGLVIFATLPVLSAPAWQLLDDGEPTPGAAKIAYDTARQRPVMLVDTGINTLDSVQATHPGSTWELVDGFWKRIFVPEPVPWAPMGCSAYDDGRDVMVVFGTWTSNETWEYNGTTWTKRTLPASPPPRNRCAMAYDAARSRIVLFGGEDANLQPLGDHWEYDGTTWTQRTFRTMPTPRTEAAMSYDGAREVTVLFGGMLPFSSAYRDTWEFDGTRWREKSPSNLPPARGGAGFVYDAARARSVLFGGWTPVQTFGDTWEWDGAGWVQRFPAAAPEARRRVAMVWDPSRSKTLFFGGEPPDMKLNDTWTYDGTTWAKIADEPIPAVRAYHALAFDTTHDRLVLYGGFNGEAGPTHARPMDTWFLTSGTWQEQLDVGIPVVSYEARMIHDTATATIRGFSGAPSTGTQYPDQVYELSTSPMAWVNHDFCCPRPLARVHAMLADAPGLGGAYLYGGELQNGVTSDECWSLSESTWTQHVLAPSPGQRKNSAMTYDSLRNRLVLYGGHPGFSTLIKASDTWAFDGVRWERLLETSPPGERSRQNIAYDASRDRVVLLGDGPGSEFVTWEFDGSQWSAIPTPVMPDATRCDTPLAYDSVREVVWLFGGRRCVGSGTFNDTWAFGEDDDGDWKVGGLDNCRQIANPDQANGDGDKAGDVCDCAPADSSAYAAPLPVSGLALSGAGTTSLTWADQSAAIGSGVRYDVAKGTLSELRSGSAAGATCLASQIAVASTSDGEVPAASEGLWYLVRARNACGRGGYGSAVVDAGSPCP